ncbi:preprotein translocase subunit SecA [Coprothermobacter platensis]|uniref:preprotein translocase subunit SecA n=1 Tax=Coprothermobacter platensis TaxID=108819 RepID=UPI000380040D|nr:preprotein translocase subunit SecA [Coprothermobacter platensis]
MLNWFQSFSKDRKLKKYYSFVDAVNAFEEETSRLSDEELEQRKFYFQDMLAKGRPLDDLLPEMFAVVREVAKRRLNMRHFDVQLIGGKVLFEGKVAEMKTGEGKTLVATLPVYAMAVSGHKVHVVTVNEYLAKRDSNWMRPIYEGLGLRASYIYTNQSSEEKREAYAADVVYGTNYEFGFDYLRDNMALSLGDIVQQGLDYAIIDEADSVLIDEARTPLIISGPGQEDTRIYYELAKLARRMVPGNDFELEEKERNVILTEPGAHKVERYLKLDNLYSPENADLLRKVLQALRAEYLYKAEVDYIVKDGEVIIIDEFTGRLMYGRRYSDGLHQAIEAKENVQVKGESQVLALISYQNFFKLYKRIAGMTGTAATAANEFSGIYNMDVVVVPTNKPMIREDLPDVIYSTEDGKFKAIVEDIKNRHMKGQPVLVGTRSVEKSEKLSKMLKKEGIVHEVLNAKYHEKEAEIIAKAGQKNAVTVATNMAGRGVDIVLGEGVADLGGLHVIGSERHEARRIDDQLRGRSGRQGDPGSSQFYLSLEDELLKLYGGDTLKNIFDKLHVEEDDRIEHPLLTRAIETAQHRVESYNYEIRKHLLDYDNVLGQQREYIYKERRQILELDSIEAMVTRLAEHFAEDIGKDADEAEKQLLALGIHVENLEGMSDTEVKDAISKAVINAYHEKKNELNAVDPDVDKKVMLRVMDWNFINHLQNMEYLQQGIGWQALGQKDPLVEYQYQAATMFEEMLSNVRKDFFTYFLNLRIVQQERTSREQKDAKRKGRSR